MVPVAKFVTDGEIKAAVWPFPFLVPIFNSRPKVRVEP